MRNPHPLSSSQLVAGIETLINAGQYGAAIRRLKPLLHDHTDDARLHHIAGVAQLRAGRAAKAITHFRKAVRLQPGRGEYLFHLGEAARVGGQYRLALDAYDKAIKAGESVYAVKIRLGDTCERMGRLDQALAHFEQALATLPSDTALAVRIANLLNRLDRRDEAIALLSRIVRCNPNGAAYNNLGIMLRDVGEITEALDALAKACELAPDAVEYLCNLARVQQDALLYDDAADSLHRAVDLAPKEPRALIALATLEERRNNLTIAEELAREVLDKDPGNAEAALVMARLARRQGQPDAAIKALSDLANLAALPLELGTAVASERGFAFDRLGDEHAAIAAFAEANALHEQGPVAGSIDHDAFFRDIDLQRDRLQHNRHQVLSVAADGYADPIFLIGFPRSGTTLLEQALAGHADVLTSDEQPVLDRLVRGENFPTDPGREEITVLRGRYFRAMEEGLGPLNGRRLIDKLPLNIVYIDAIRRLFPEARIIVALRDPRDVVLSCWMQNFRLNEAMVQFLDIERTAAAYAAVMSFWRDHRDLLDGRYIEYRYEDLVDDFDATLRRLVAFVGLPWDDGVLGFGKTAAGHVISTPSARDVSGGQIYRRARGRWHRYRAFLEPVLPVLALCLEAFGYDD